MLIWSKMVWNMLGLGWNKWFHLQTSTFIFQPLCSSLHDSNEAWVDRGLVQLLSSYAWDTRLTFSVSPRFDFQCPPSPSGNPSGSLSLQQVCTCWFRLLPGLHSNGIYIQPVLHALLLLLLCCGRRRQRREAGFTSVRGSPTHTHKPNSLWSFSITHK